MQADARLSASKASIHLLLERSSHRPTSRCTWWGTQFRPRSGSSPRPFSLQEQASPQSRSAASLLCSGRPSKKHRVVMRLKPVRSSGSQFADATFQFKVP